MSPNRDESNKKLTVKQRSKPQGKSAVVQVHAQDAEIAEMEDEDFSDDDFE